MKIRTVTIHAQSDGYPFEISLEFEENDRLEIVSKMTARLNELGYDVPQPTKPSLLTGPSIPNLQGSHTIAIPAEEMVCTVSDGVPYWKVRGGEYRKFGVTIWPEVLEAAGFDPKRLNPLEAISLKGYTATILLKENGQPKKVLNLIGE